MSVGQRQQCEQQGGQVKTPGTSGSRGGEKASVGRAGNLM